MASLMLVPAVCVELVVAVESLPTEAALGMALEAALVDGSRVVVAKFFVLVQLGWREQLMLVREDLFIPSAEVAGGMS